MFRDASAGASTTPVALAACLAGLRRFSANTELLADGWIRSAIAPVSWQIDPNCRIPQGAEGGFSVVSAFCNGYAKPRGRHNADPLQRPVAAYEKIASDLAYLLRLPVPPVTLYERAAAPGGEPRHHAVSAMPFNAFFSWRKTLEQPALAARIRAFTPPVMSAMVAFDTWVHAHDHCNNPENLLVAPSAVPGFAFIDYGQSLLEKWRGGGFTTPFAAPLYDGETKMDVCTLRAAVAAIETIPNASIRAIVARIPAEFLAAAHAKVIIEGLLYRRDHLREMLASRYRELAG